MTYDSENHEYPIPESHERDWDDPLQTIFEALDTDVEIRDVDSNRSAYAPVDGAKFLATDTQAVYVGNGSSWDQIGVVADVDTTSTDVSDSTGVVVSATNDITFEAGGNTSVNVVDDGDDTATVTYDASASDSHTDVSDSGGLVVSDTADITFTASSDASVTVSDDGDGTATVDYSASAVDTHTDVSDSGGVVVSGTDDVTFTAGDNANVSVTDDGDNTATVQYSGDPKTHTASGSVGLERSGSANNRYNVPVFLENGEGIDWERGSLSLSDGSTNSSVKLSLFDWTGTEIENATLGTAPTIADKSTSDTELTNNSGNPQRAYFAVVNGSSTDYTASSSAADAVEFEFIWSIDG